MEPIVESLEEDLLLEEKEKTFDFSKAAFKRPGVILRLISFGLIIIATILAIVLPTVTLEYASYTSTSVLTTAQINSFPAQLLSGADVLFGGGTFAYYSTLKVTNSQVLTVGLTGFNYFLLVFLLLGFLGIVLGFFITFSKKLEKWSKLAILLIVLAGIGVLASPVWFVAINQLSYYGQTQQLAGGTSNTSHYMTLDDLYIHCAYGAIVSMFVYIAGAVCFAVGTSLENKGGEGRGGGDA